MTPNLGAGGNTAIESVAALANSISNLTDPDLSLDKVQDVLKGFYMKRHKRANSVCKSANELTRVEALATARQDHGALRYPKPWRFLE
jgi:2-polyprenyl-6-methoxyphenol hydroxylase-like FAD-dependent oxidoreductase